MPEQNESCAAASATPPALSTPMSRVVLSEERLTWYSGAVVRAVQRPGGAVRGHARRAARGVDVTGTWSARAARALGDADDADDADGEAPVEDAVPVQTMPLRVKLVGTGLVPVQAPLNPNEVEAPVATDPL